MSNVVRPSMVAPQSQLHPNPRSQITEIDKNTTITTTTVTTGITITPITTLLLHETHHHLIAVTSGDAMLTADEVHTRDHLPIFMVRLHLEVIFMGLHLEVILMGLHLEVTSTGLRILEVHREVLRMPTTSITTIHHLLHHRLVGEDRVGDIPLPHHRAILIMTRIQMQVTKRRRKMRWSAGGRPTEKESARWCLPRQRRRLLILILMLGVVKYKMFGMSSEFYFALLLEISF